LPPTWDWPLRFILSLLNSVIRALVEQQCGGIRGLPGHLVALQAAVISYSKVCAGTESRSGIDVPRSAQVTSMPLTRQ
jgi:hypothetical protein